MNYVVGYWRQNTVDPPDQFELPSLSPHIPLNEAFF